MFFFAYVFLQSFLTTVCIKEYFFKASQSAILIPNSYFLPKKRLSYIFLCTFMYQFSEQVRGSDRPGSYCLSEGQEHEVQAATHHTLQLFHLQRQLNRGSTVYQYRLPHITLQLFHLQRQLNRGSTIYQYRLPHITLYNSSAFRGR